MLLNVQVECIVFMGSEEKVYIHDCFTNSVNKIIISSVSVEL